MFWRFGGFLNAFALLVVLMIVMAVLEVELQLADGVLIVKFQYFVYLIGYRFSFKEYGASVRQNLYLTLLLLSQVNMLIYRAIVVNSDSTITFAIVED